MSEPLFDKLTPVRLSEQVASRIETVILERQLRPGDRLPSERELSEAFGVSRPVVRESLKFLEERGLVNSRSGRGAFISDPGWKGISNSLNAAYHLQNCTPGDLYEARWCIESCTARLAALRATEEELASMERAVAVMDANLNAPERFLAGDAEFHAALAASTHNPLFMAMAGPLVEMILNLGHAAFAHVGFEERHQKHKLILERVRSRDARGAEAAMREHLNLGRRDFSAAGPGVLNPGQPVPEGLGYK